MPRTAKAPTIAAIIEEVVNDAVERIHAIVRKADRSAARQAPARSASKLKRSPGRPRAPAPVKNELTVWTANRRARRVPSFVIEATGLDTKKKLVERFGKNVTFRKGQPLPLTMRVAAAEPKKRRLRLPKQRTASVHAVGALPAKPKGPTIRKAVEVAAQKEASSEKPLVL